MAKKEEEEVKSRVLSIRLGGSLAAISDTDTMTFAGDGQWNAYFLAAPLSGCIIYNIQTIDLSGYTLQDLTLFPQGVLMQDMNIGVQGGTAAFAERATIVSTTPISEADLIKFNAGGQWQLPGTMGSTYELTNILSGRNQGYYTLTTLAGLQQISESSWGSGDSTAGEKIWVCDAYRIENNVGNIVTLPDQAFVLPSIIAHEPELEYMMRLSRSLEPVY